MKLTRSRFKTDALRLYSLCYRSECYHYNLLSLAFARCADQATMGTIDEDANERLAVGMELASVPIFHRRVKEFCVEDDFSLRHPIYRDNYLKVICSSNVRCPFMIRASRVFFNIYSDNRNVCQLPL